MALAAAIHAGMSLGNSALEGVFRDTLDRVAGRAQIQVAGAGGVPEELLQKVREIECVSEAAATILRPVPLRLPGETAIAVLGVDLLEDDRFRDYALESDKGEAGRFDDALVLLAQPDSVLVTKALATRHGLSKGSALPVWAGREDRDLTVRGLLADTDLTGAYGGNLAVMDLYAAQHVFSRRGLFDRIDIQAREGADVEACSAAISESLEGRFDVSVTARAGGSTRAFTAMYDAMVDASTLLALLAALMMIHHASAVAVAQREREIAILVALGADEGRMRRFVLAEASAAGALGGALGLGIGYWAARPLAGALQGVLRSALGFVIEPGAADLDPLWAGGMILAAAGVAFAGAWSTAQAAGRIPPIQLAGARRYSERGERRAAVLVQAALLAVAAFAVQRLWRDNSVLCLSLPLALAALWRVARGVEGRLFRLTGLAIGAAWPLAGALAVESLARERRRVRGPLLAIAFSTAVLVTVSGVTGSYADSFLGWAAETIRVDYVVHSAGSLSEQGALFSAETHRRLLAVEGVAEAARLRRLTGRAAGRRARLFAVDLEVWKQAAGLPPPSSANGAMVARNFALRAGLEEGERFAIESPSGPVELRADQIVDDYISELGAVYFEWDLYERAFRSDAIEMVGLVLGPNANREETRERIVAALPEGAPVLIVDPSQISAHIQSMVDRWRRAQALQAAALVPIAILAAGSFLTVSLLGKRGQLAILEALGAGPAEIRGFVYAEAVALGLAGSLLGLALGVLLQLFVLDALEQILLGFDLGFVLDWRLAIGLLAAGPAGAIAAAWIPTRAICRAQLVRQLAGES